MWYTICPKCLCKVFALGLSHSILRDCSFHLKGSILHYGKGSPALKLAALQQVCNDLTEVETLKGCLEQEQNHRHK